MPGTPLPKALIIGDSISIGYTPTVQRLLRDRVDVHRIPENGGATTFALAKIEQWLGDDHWDVIHFNWGLHDLKFWKDGRLDMSGDQVCPPDCYQRNLGELVAKLKQTGAILIWATTTPVPEGAAGRVSGQEIDYNAISERIAATRGVIINDLHTFISDLLDQYQEPHNVHFKQQGYELLGAKVAEAIEAALR